MISKDHDLSLEKSIDIVLAHELKISESENLYQVFKNNASETSMDSMISIISSSAEDTKDKYKKVSTYIYKLRCNVAHLRYDQDDMSNIDWDKCVQALIEIIFSLYQKCDSDIIQICTSKSSWKPLSI